MKITAIRLMRMRLPLDPPFYAAWDPLPRRHFDATLAGWRPTRASPGTARATPWTASSRSSRLFTGRDPLQHRQPRRRLERSASTPAGTGRSRPRCGTSLGQVTGQPVSVLFGGPAHGPARLRLVRRGRGPAARAQAAVAAKAAGFRAMKIRISRTDWVSSLEAVRATRAAVGEDVAIMADLNQWWRMPGDLSPALDETQVRRIAAELAELGVFWLEEPLPARPAACARCAADRSGRRAARWPRPRLSCSTRSRPARSTCSSPTWCSPSACCAPAPSPSWPCCGNRWFTPHTWTNGLGLLANLHVAAGVGGGPYLEFPYDPPGWTPERRDFFLTEPVRIDAEGCLAVPDTPGLGASIDHAAVARYRDIAPSAPRHITPSTGTPVWMTADVRALYHRADRARDHSRRRPPTSAAARRQASRDPRAHRRDAAVVVTDAALAATPVIATVTGVLAEAAVPAGVLAACTPTRPPTTWPPAPGGGRRRASALRGRRRARPPRSPPPWGPLRPSAPAAPAAAPGRAGGGGRRVGDRRGQGDRHRRGQPAARPGPGLPRRLRRARPADRGGADHGGDGRGDQRRSAW